MSHTLDCFLISVKLKLNDIMDGSSDRYLELHSEIYPAYMIMQRRSFDQPPYHILKISLYVYFAECKDNSNNSLHNYEALITEISVCIWTRITDLVFTSIDKTQRRVENSVIASPTN